MLALPPAKLGCIVLLYVHLAGKASKVCWCRLNVVCGAEHVTRPRLGGPRTPRCSALRLGPAAHLDWLLMKLEKVCVAIVVVAAAAASLPSVRAPCHHALAVCMKRDPRCCVPFPVCCLVYVWLSPLRLHPHPSTHPHTLTHTPHIIHPLSVIRKEYASSKGGGGGGPSAFASALGMFRAAKPKPAPAAGEGGEVSWWWEPEVPAGCLPTGVLAGCVRAACCLP